MPKRIAKQSTDGAPIVVPKIMVESISKKTPEQIQLRIRPANRSMKSEELFKAILRSVREFYTRIYD
jgi:hypothetical protein